MAIDTAFVNSYRSQFEVQFQQMESRLRDTVTVLPQNAEFQYFDRLGTLTARAVTARHGNTEFDEIDYTRRRNGILSYDNAVPFDKEDSLRMISDPRMGIAKNQASAILRQMDSTIITAATATAYGGKAGATSYAYTAATYGIAVDAVAPGAAAVNTNLTIEKLIQARSKFYQNEAVEAGEQLYFIASQRNLDSLLRTTEVTSADYNGVRSLVTGMVDTFLGFKFIRTELLSKSGNIRTCLAYPKSAIILGLADELKVRIDERFDKRYMWQVYSCATFGATRMWEEKVVSVACDESVA